MRDYSALELSGMSALQASQTFQQGVLDLNRTEPDFIQCWARARDLMPRLFAKAFPESSGNVVTAMANGTPAPAVPAAYQFHLPLMVLPADCTIDEFKAAWLGNGGKATPLDAHGMIEALAGFTAGRQNIPIETARAKVAQRFPALTDFANKQRAALPNALTAMAS